MWGKVRTMLVRSGTRCHKVRIIRARGKQKHIPETVRGTSGRSILFYDLFMYYYLQVIIFMDMIDI